MIRLSFIGASMLVLVSCSGANESAADYGLAEEASVETDAASPQTARAKAEGDAAGAAIPVSIAQIAYSYDYGFRLPTSEIPKAQQTHVELCERQGPQICRILNMESSGGEGDYASGMLHIEVAAAKARKFGEQLAKTVNDKDGKQISASISGEDLSKQIVDTEARLRSRELLSVRLTDLLRTRKGTVAELVAAERAVTQVNEEIDQARSWLREMRGRVAFSKIVINYESGSPVSGGFWRPIRESFNGIASTLGFTIGAAMTLVAFILPWLLIVAVAVYVWRRFGYRIKRIFSKREPDHANANITTDDD